MRIYSFASYYTEMVQSSCSDKAWDKAVDFPSFISGYQPTRRPRCTPVVMQDSVTKLGAKLKTNLLPKFA